VNTLFQSSTSHAVSEFIRDPSHALLLTGPAGSGKGTAAEYIAKSLIFDQTGSFEDYPYALRYRDQEKGVSIESIRLAQNFMQLKTPGSRRLRRVLIVEQAETMSLEAQNAFLKLLEEPPEDTLIIMTSTSLERLLPTIRSRVQHIRLLAPSVEQLVSHYADLYASAAIKRAYFTSEGYMGLMQALLDQDAEHPLVEQISVAKQLLAGSTYDRLARVDEITKQKNVGLLLHALERVCHASLIQSVQNSSPAANSWAKRLSVVLSAEDSMSHNPQTKLLLTNLMLNL